MSFTKDFQLRVGATIHFIRDEKGLTKEDLQSKTAISTPEIAHIEAGNYGSLPMVCFEDIAKALDVNIEDLARPRPYSKAYPFATLLRQMRKQRGMTLGDLGTQLGVSPEVVLELETGTITPDLFVLQKLVEYFEWGETFWRDLELQPPAR